MINKTIKIKFVNFWGGFNPETTAIVKILRKHFSEVVVTDDADYLVTSVYGEYSYLKYPQVRIMYSGENYVPDFNLVDYAYSSYPIEYFDRHFHFPQGFHRASKNEYLMQRSRGETRFDRDFLASKTVFANFCASHESEHGFRGSFFQKLCEYKKVDSIGSYLNNTGVQVNWQNNSKYEYQKKCKFSLCFESTAHKGFHTEKIVDAFCADTIPIYFGDPNITDIYNPKAFINVGGYATVDEAIEAIIQIDKDDDLYLSMLNEPILRDPELPMKIQKGFEDWVVHIFEQPLEEAYRRSRVFFADRYEQLLIRLSSGKQTSKRAELLRQTWKEKLYGWLRRTKLGNQLLDRHQIKKMKK